MIKIVVLGCTICAGVGGTALLVKSGGNTAADPTAVTAASAFAIEEVLRHTRSNELPIQVVLDPI